MIRRRVGYFEILFKVGQRVDYAHVDLTRMIGELRNVTVQAYTVLFPPLQAAGQVNLLGWRNHFANELAVFTEWRADAVADGARARFPEVDAALADYLEAVPRVVAALDFLLSRYPSASTVSQLVTTAHRQALANAMEAELVA